VTLGPVQLLVIALEGGDFTGRIRAELDRLSSSETIRVLDLVFVAKELDEALRMFEGGDLGDGTGDHVLLRLLSGDAELDTAHLDGATEAELVDAAASIPPGTAAAIVLLEHRWAAPLRAAVADAGGVTVAETWLAQEDLATVGLA
jgi:hypothetical protein